MSTYMIRDESSGIFINMNEEKFLERLELAERRRKAKHAGRFGMEEFAKLFGMRPILWDQFTEIDRNYPISFDYSTHELPVLDASVNYYVLTYKTKWIGS